MILVAGGEFDTNINFLCNRLRHRSVSYKSLLVGPNHTPRLRIDLQENTFNLDKEILFPRACFIRHDVFLHQAPNVPLAQAGAINWYQAIRGWAISQPSIRLFNRHTHLREYNKIENLLVARAIGLPVPETIVTNDFSKVDGPASARIQKPVAGGEYTTLLSDFVHEPEQPLPYPRFIQSRLQRPEMRIYRIGSSMLAYTLSSQETDYRRTQQVEINPVPVPSATGDLLMRLCDHLNLDFAAADFMEDEHGNLHFLEVNSQPMFAAFDQASEGKLCDAIIDHLIG